ncbi:MAG: polyisoprenyl-teichoic acid--peptidoglycan teichoic acid transferase, partial [Gaiellales bacterium]|nr:polyisoprenyl-teichoic acid--peptidoglycan teichoic acid transferase [Gaiellales bacterium]
IDPGTKLMSVLSLPRDLYVPINGVCCSKINDAYSQGGLQLALQTVKEVTGIRPNYLMTVDFGGFKKLVGAFKGVYIPVDQRYHHDNALGGDQYSEIDITPGYQQLDGPDALAYARFRHTDSDFYRNARQQVFMEAFEQRASSQLNGVGLEELQTFKAVAEDVAGSVQVTGPNGAPSLQTMIRYLSLGYQIKGRVVSVKLDAAIGGDTTNSYVTSDPDAISRARYAFMHPDTVITPKDELPGKADGPAEPTFKPRVEPTTVPMTIVNGNGVQGAAATAGTALTEWGYPATVSLQPATTTFAQSTVFYRPRMKDAATDVADIVGDARTQRMTPEMAPFSTNGIVLVVGETFKDTLKIPAPKKVINGGLPDDITRDPTIYRSTFRAAHGPANFRVYYPTVYQNVSHLCPLNCPSASSSDPAVWLYTIKDAGGGKNSLYAYFSYNGLAGSYWGIQQTRFTGAPILANPDQERELDRRTYKFYFNGSHIHMVAFIQGGVAYWVQNTLRDDMSNEDMIAIARSLKPA